MSGAAAGQSARVLVVKVGGAHVGIEIGRVREVVLPLKVTPVPDSPELVEGVCNLRGTITPVVDMRRRLGAPSDAGPASRLVVVVARGGPLAVAVDKVLGVAAVRRDEVQRLPASEAARRGAQAFVGACSFRGEMMLLLLPDELLSGDVTAGLKDLIAQAGGDAAGSP